MRVWSRFILTASEITPFATAKKKVIWNRKKFFGIEKNLTNCAVEIVQHFIAFKFVFNT